MNETPEQQPDTPSWSQVIWSAVVAAIGFGFAIYRYLQFSGAAAELRLSRLERPLYRLAGKWGIITVFILMGIVGLYNAVKHYRNLRKQ